MSDRETLTKIREIMRNLLLVRLDGLNPIPRKGTTRHECYRALYQIQELLETNRFFANLPPQTNADRIRAMSDEELAKMFDEHNSRVTCPEFGMHNCQADCEKCWLSWLKSPAEVEG